ncbi:MAG: VTT domain-containing protein [Elusimicrobia bacterium]|nr:VTT domain-containing protein [Elusimicrobiota bacterium]
MSTVPADHPRPRRRGAVRKRWLFLLVAVVFLAFFTQGIKFSFFDLFPVHRIIHWVDMAHANRWLTLLFYVFFSFGVICFPITIFPIIGGLLFPFALALPLNVAAATLGGWMSFRLGRIFGRKAVEPFLRGNLKTIDRLAASEGWRTVLALRLVGVPPFLITNFALGLSAVRDRDMIIGTALGIAPWMTLITYLSTTLWQAIVVGGERGLAKALLHSVAPLSAVSVTVIATIVISSWMKRRKAAAKAAAV